MVKLLKKLYHKNTVEVIFIAVFSAAAFGAWLTGEDTVWICVNLTLCIIGCMSIQINNLNTRMNGFCRGEMKSLQKDLRQLELIEEIMKDVLELKKDKK